MKTMTRCAALSFAFLGVCQAQTNYPPAGYPQRAYPQGQQYQQFPQQPAQAHPLRAMFAQSLAQVVQTGGSAAVVAVADGLTGALKNWFDSKRQRKGQNGALGSRYYARPPQTLVTTSSYPQTPPTSSSYPQTQYPATDTYPPTDGSA